MALSRPSGSATTIDKTAVRKVPDTSASTPNCLDWNSGVQRVPVMNSRNDTSPKNCSASNSSTKTMPAVVSTEARVQTTSSALMPCSMNARRARNRRRRASGAIPAATPMLLAAKAVQPPHPANGSGQRRRRRAAAGGKGAAAQQDGQAQKKNRPAENGKGGSESRQKHHAPEII